MKKTFQEFKQFIQKGNAMDLAVGLIMGTAFNNIIKSLVSNIFTPLLSLITNTSLENQFLVLKGSVTFDEISGQYVRSQDAILLEYGVFLSSVIDFFIVALALFLTLKLLTYMNKRVDAIKDDIHEIKEDILEKIKK